MPKNLVKTVAVRAVLALSLGISISSLANASKAPSPDEGIQVVAISESAAHPDDLVLSELNLDALLVDASTVVSASFAGVEHSVGVTNIK